MSPPTSLPHVHIETDLLCPDSAQVINLPFGRQDIETLPACFSFEQNPPHRDSCVERDPLDVEDIHRCREDAATAENVTCGSEREEDLDEFAMVLSFQAAVEGAGAAVEKKRLSVLIRSAMPVRGIKMVRVRATLHRWYQEWKKRHGPVPVHREKAFAFLLIESGWYEDKVAAVLFMQEVIVAKRKLSGADLPRFESMFRGGFASSYKICDHLAEKVLRYVLCSAKAEADLEKRVTDAFFDWAWSEDLWKGRTGLLTLCTDVSNSATRTRLFPVIKHMLARPEDEARSCAGTALRSVCEVDPASVIDFLNKPEHLLLITTDSLQKATAKLSKDHKDHFKLLRRRIQSC